MKKIMVCLDFTDITDRILDEACNFAKAMDASLHLVYVSATKTEKVTHVVSSENQQKISVIKMKENSKLESLESDCREKGLVCESYLLEGSVNEAIAVKAEELNIDFFIIGSHTTSAATHVIKGSVGAELLKRLHKPVLLVPHK